MHRIAVGRTADKERKTMNEMGSTHHRRDQEPVWAVTIRFDEDGVRTTANVRLQTAKRVVEAQGTARRSPADPLLPQVGEDLAVARALTHLAHELVGDAIHRLEEATHAPAGIADRTW